MSSKTLGIIGQAYENSKTGKKGVLLDRNEKYMTLTLQAEDGTTFSISNATFRSSWRKCKDEIVTSNDEVEQVEETNTTESPVEEVSEIEESDEVETQDEENDTEDEKVKSIDNYKKKTTKGSKKFDTISDEDAIASFKTFLEDKRKVEITNDDGISVIIDDVKVININTITNLDNISDNTYHLDMLPDVFALTEWSGILNPLTTNFDMGRDDKLCIGVDTFETNLADIFYAIGDVVVDINLYGYKENEESEED